MNNINYYLSIILKYKFWIIGITIIATLIAIIITSPKISPQVYEIKHEYKLKTLPELADIDSYFIINSLKKNSQFQQNIISKYNTAQEPLNKENFFKKIIVKIDKVGKLTIIVKYLNKNTGVAIAKDIYTTVNQKIHQAVCLGYFHEIDFRKQKIAIKQQEIDSVAQKLIQQNAEFYPYKNNLKLLISANMNPNIIYNQSLLTYYSNDINKLNNEIKEFELIINNPVTYLKSINNYNLNNIKTIPNRMLITILTFLITLFCSFFFFIIKDSQLLSISKNKEILSQQK